MTQTPSRAMIWVRSVIEVGYIATAAILAIVATADPNDKDRWAFIATTVLCLPSFIPLLPVFYAVVGSAWHLTGADNGGITWPVTAAYVGMFTLAAVLNVLLAAGIINARRRAKERSKLPNDPSGGAVVAP